MRVFLIGGFLGSGKTTAITQACEELMGEGRRVAVITNDQGLQQVDTAYVNSRGIPVKQVSNGCFCCQYDQLDKHLQDFIREMDPEIVFAESVGSCTDLVATVAKPLALIWPKSAISISVFADAGLVFSLMTGRASFISEEIQYIYKNQLKEADLLVLNKSDLLMDSGRMALQQRLRYEYPRKKMIFQNSLDAADIRKWVQAMEDIKLKKPRESLELEYERYAKGEMQLSWLDYKVLVRSSGTPVATVISSFIQWIGDALRKEMNFAGHVKFMIEADGYREKISLTSTGSDRHKLLAMPDVLQTEMVINARVQGEPDWLGELIHDQIIKANQQEGIFMQAFEGTVYTPGYPTPRHRIQ